MGEVSWKSSNALESVGRFSISKKKKGRGNRERKSNQAELGKVKAGKNMGK